MLWYGANSDTATVKDILKGTVGTFIQHLVMYVLNVSLTLARTQVAQR